MTLIEYKNTEFKIRSIHIDGESWFVAKDVCEMLGISNHRDAAGNLDEDERDDVGIADAIGRHQKTLIVSESGLYALIFQSRKPEAKAFRRWVTGEVLPALRRDGEYRMRHIDQQRVCEVKSGVENTKKKLASQIAHLWKVQEVEGNVSLKAYLTAAGISLPPRECMRLGARCNYRCRVTGDAVGKLQQRRGRTQKLSEGHCRYGWHLVATFPPAHIAVELRGMGYDHVIPDASQLLTALRALLPEGHRLNPATPMVSLYLH